MASDYGSTWWGNQWLNALAKIDNSNRLPRGRTYANKGTVSKLEVKESEILARVQGSRATPYKIKIVVPKLSSNEITRLLDQLALQPMLISRILNRELDPAIMEIARSEKIQIFPSRWQDLQMSCSCPDYAVPCKHLAATIYVLSREIDGNPFLIFSLKGLDLGKELSNRGIAIAQAAQAALPTINTLLQGQTEIAGASTPVTFSWPDYSQLPDMAETLQAVLPAAPSFYPQGDFREIYAKQLQRCAKAAQRALQTAPKAALDTDSNSRSPNLQNFFGAKPASMIVQEDLQLTLLEMGNIRDLVELDAVLQSLSELELADLPAEIVALYHCRIASLQFLARQAVVPQILDIGKGNVGVRWQPANLTEVQQELLRNLASLMPSSLLRMQVGHSLQNPPPLMQASMLCGFFLDLAIKQCGATSASSSSLRGKIPALFFSSLTTQFAGSGEGALAASIQVWLSRYHLQQQALVPTLTLAAAEANAETGADFALSIAVQRRQAALDQVRPTPLAEVLRDPNWEKQRYGVLQTISLLTEFFPPLAHYVNNGAQQAVPLSLAALPNFLFDSLPIIRLLGIGIVLPKGMQSLLRPQLALRVKSSSKAQQVGGFLSFADLFAFDWAVAIGEHHISAAEFEKLIKNAHGIVQFKGEYVFLDAQEIAKLRTALKQEAQEAQPTSANLMRSLMAEEYQGVPLRFDENTRELMAELSDTSTLALPHSLQAQLRPYQERGYAWLYRNIKLGLGSVIADDMGLGKTLQVISSLLKLKEEGQLDQQKVLVIVPTSLLSNWEKEIQRFAPSLSCAVFHGANRSLEKARPDIVLTTYGTVRSDVAKLKNWRGIAW